MHCVSRGGCYLVNSFCDLHEENQWKKESYQACWLSVVLETRPQYKLKLSEADSLRMESNKREQVVHFSVQRSPSQTLRLSSSTGACTEYQLPILSPGRTPHLAKGISVTQQQKQQTGRPDTHWMGVDGECRDKQEVTGRTQSPTKPPRDNFRASSLMASPGETSHRAHKRE